MTSEELRIIRRFCGAILELRNKQPYKNYVKLAADQVNFTNMTDRVRADLTEAIILNTVSHKEHPFEQLQRKYSLPVSHNEFSARKTEFCIALARECGFAQTGGTTERWNKADVLNMLYSIANEANECITTEKGTFNHQVAGVALKAIDQAVKLSGLGTQTDDSTVEVTFDQEAEQLGA